MPCKSNCIEWVFAKNMSIDDKTFLSIDFPDILSIDFDTNLSIYIEH